MSEHIVSRKVYFAIFGALMVGTAATVVVAFIDHARATLKRIFRRGDEVELRPSNTSLEPICLHASRVEIQGIYRGLLRPNT